LYILDIPTKNAQNINRGEISGKKNTKAVEIKKAPAVCPEGKENLSGGLIKKLIPSITQPGLSLLTNNFINFCKAISNTNAIKTIKENLVPILKLYKTMNNPKKKYQTPSALFEK